MYKVKSFNSLTAYEMFLERESNIKIVSVNTIKKIIVLTYKSGKIKHSNSKLPDPRGQEPVWSS